MVMYTIDGVDMIPFLKGFLNNLNAIQSKQIMRILSQMRDRGEIRNAVDFETKLADLVSLVKKDELTQRTPVFVFQEGDLLESDVVRTFIDLVKLDLEAALGETEQLGNAIRAHNRILTENYLDVIESSISELESETTAYEVLEARKFTGFSSVLKQWLFSGAIAVPGASVTDSFTSSLFVDSRGNEKLWFSPPGIGEPGLHLGIDRSHSEYEDTFDEVEILTDSTTPQTALSTATSNNTPIQAIDNSRDTAWRHSVLIPDYPDYCRLIFSVSFVGAKRVNAISIDPLSDIPMKIVSIFYVDSGGKTVDLQIGSDYAGQTDLLFEHSSYLGSRLSKDDDWILPNKKKIIPVGDIIVSKFIITFQQDTAGDGEFFYYDADVGSWQKGTPLEDCIRGYMRDHGGASGMEVPLQLGFIGSAVEDRRQARFAEYVFGLKEISTLSREYTPNGFFVPESFTLSKAPNILALYSDVFFPIGQETDIEFLIHKENYDSNNTLIDKEVIPILSYGDSSVNEKLFLVELQSATLIRNTGFLRFYPDFSQTFEVYKDDALLTLGLDYQISVDNGDTFESVIPPVGIVSDPLKCLVKVQSPQPGVFYQVSYTPLVGSFETGSEVWLNKDHTVKLDRYQTYVFNNQRTTGVVSSCKLGLQIIIRSSTLNTRISPYLRELILLGG